MRIYIHTHMHILFIVFTQPGTVTGLASEELGGRCRRSHNAHKHYYPHKCTQVHTHKVADGVVVTAVCCVFPPPGSATPPVCLTSHLDLFCNHAHLVFISNQLPFINPWIPCCRCQIVLRTTVVMIHAWLKYSCYLALALSSLVVFDHNSTLFSSACSYPDPSLQFACLAPPPATSSNTCLPASFNKPFFFNPTSSPSALGFSIV